MKFILNFLLIGFVGFLLIGCKKNDALTEQEVLKVVDKFDYAWQTKQDKMVDSVLAPEYIYFTRSGNLFSREGVVETAASQQYLLDSMNRSHLTIRLHDNVAVVSSLWYGKGNYFNKPFNETQRCSIVIIKNNGKVEIVSEHCAPVMKS